MAYTKSQFASAPLDEEGFALTDRWYCKETSTYYPAGTTTREIEKDVDSVSDNELGAIETGAWSAKGFVPTDRAQRNGDSPALSVRCSFGRIVASVMRNDDEYNDIAIDLMTDDGRGLQLAVVSCSEACSDDNDAPHILVLPFDGKDDSPFDSFEVSITDSSPWYE